MTLADYAQFIVYSKQTHQSVIHQCITCNCEITLQLTFSATVTNFHYIGSTCTTIYINTTHTETDRQSTKCYGTTEETERADRPWPEHWDGSQCQ